MENVKYCQASPREVQMAWQVGLSAGVAVFAMLFGLGSFLLHRQAVMLAPYRWQALLVRLLPGLTLASALIYMVDALEERHSLVTCDPWGSLQWVAFVVHLCFMVRLVINWCVTYRPQVVATVVDVWLFTQACISLAKGLNLYAFTFLTLVRFFHSECLMAWSHLSSQVCTGVAVVLVVLTTAGTLQVAEEYNTIYGTHSTAQGTLQPMRSFWTYVYWTVVSLSTIGYGEITPSTGPGRAVATAISVVGFMCYMTVGQRLSLILGRYFQEGRYPPLWSRCPRIVVLGESHPGNLARLLKAIKQGSDDDIEVIVLMPPEKTRPYLHLSSQLPIKVVSCTSLQEDLTSLLPCMDNSRHSSVHQRDAVVICGDHEAKSLLAEDIRVLELLVQARKFVFGRRFIVQVLLSRSRGAVQQTPCWSAQDVVVCMEELIVDLLAQTAACEAAAMIMANLLKAPTASPRDELEDECSLRLFGEMQDIRLYEPPKPISKAGFVDAALRLYEEEGSLLLGWFSPNTQTWALLTDELPPDALWVIISANVEPPKVLLTIPRGNAEKCIGDPQEVSVAVLGMDTGLRALEAVLAEFPEVRLLQGHEKYRASTMVMTTVGMGPKSIIDVHYRQNHLRQDERTREVRFVTDVHYGEGQRALDPRTTSTVVSKSMVVSAVAAAVLDRHMYTIWRQLASNCEMVGVQVLANCTYGDAFQAALLEQLLLPLGVKKVIKDDYCITNPPASLWLVPGDLILCLIITVPAANFSEQLVTVPDNTAHSPSSTRS